MRYIFSFCRPYLKKQRGKLILLVGLFIVVSLTSLVIPLITSYFINWLEGKWPASDLPFSHFLSEHIFIIGEVGSTSYIWNFALLLAAFALFEFIISYIVERLYIKVQMRSGYALNADAIRHVQNVHFGFVQGKNTAFLNQQINNDANSTVIFCITVLQNIISNVLSLVIPLLFVTALLPWLGAAMLALNVIYFVLYNVFKKPVYKADYEFMDEQATFFSKLDTQLSNVKFIQTQGIAKSFISRLDASIKKLLGKALRSQRAEYGFTGSDLIVKTAGSIIVFLLAGAAVFNKSIDGGIGAFTAISTYFAMSLSATQYFFGLGKQIQSNRVSCDRLAKIFAENEQTNGEIFPDDISSIECRGVSFGYDDEKIFEHLDLRLNKGGIYALAGENGSGKSTLINLILGLFIDKYEGGVFYDGVPVESLDMRAIRRAFVGVSEQEPMLLEDTLRFNLTLEEGAELNEAELEPLCAMLHLDDYLTSLPKGLDTVINESSSNLSGGEKQKLSILRALLKKPKLLVLDEPTSAMDRESRESLISYLNEHRDEMIVLLSTHDKELLDICSEVIRLG